MKEADVNVSKRIIKLERRSQLPPALRISVALATYNGCAFVEDQLRSIGSQSRPPDELIIVDDASSDPTLEIVRAFKAQARFPVIIREHTRNRGTGHAFWNAISLARGNVIAFSDQDDIWLPQKLALIERSFAHNPELAYVLSDAMVVDNDLTPLGYTLWQERGFSSRWQHHFLEGNQVETLFRLNVTTGMTTAIRSCLRYFGPPPGNHDAWYIPLAAVAGYSGGLLQEPLVKYRQHPDQQFGARKTSKQKCLSGISGSIYRSVYKQLSVARHIHEYVNKSPAQFIDIHRKEAARKERHLTARSECIALRRNRRIRLIAREVLSGNYHRYGSWKNPILDALIPRCVDDRP